MGEGVQQGKGLLVLMTEKEEVCLCEHPKGLLRRVLVGMVANEKSQFHGIIGRELGGTGLEYVELGLRPGELPQIIAHTRLLQFHLVAQGIVTVGIDHLGVEQGGLPRIPGQDINVGQFRFQLATEWGAQGRNRQSLFKYGNRLHRISQVKSQQVPPFPYKAYILGIIPQYFKSFFKLTREDGG